MLFFFHLLAPKSHFTSSSLQLPFCFVHISLTCMHTLLSIKQTLMDANIIHIVAIWKKNRLKTKNTSIQHNVCKILRFMNNIYNMQETRSTVRSVVVLSISFCYGAFFFYTIISIIHMCITQMIKNVHLLLRSYLPFSLCSNSRSFLRFEINQFRQIHT